jgi:acyl CoA:acetate/3-ketoacid CoA transferase alpha subunit
MARRRSRPSYARPHKPLHVLGGIVLMLGFVAGTLAILTQYAGAWGVPYFTFRTDRGSTCKNDLTGYTCSPMTLADIEYFGDVDLPDDSAVISGTYRSTHDYEMEAIIEVPLDSADHALTSLNQAFGNCISELPSPLTAKGIHSTCVMANDDVFTESEEPSSRLYLIGTGVRQDGTRVIGLVIKSR